MRISAYAIIEGETVEFECAYILEYSDSWDTYIQ